MASLDFPSNPTNGQTYALNGVTYYYNSTMGAWLTQLTSMNLSTSSNTQVLFNDAGLANGSSGLVYNKVAGYLGIGTTTPNSSLHLSSSSRTYISVTANAKDWLIDHRGTYDSGSNALSFAYDGTERMRITSAGNVGIGTSTPAAKIEIAGSDNGTHIIVGGSNRRLKFTTSTDSPGVTDNYIHSFIHESSSGVTKFFGDNGNALIMQLNTVGPYVGVGMSPTTRNNTTLQVKDGIGFPATQVASTDANTLDDYEEGTWTPTYAGTTSGTGTHTQQTGYYVKVGRLVTVWFIIRGTRGTTSGNLVITGLPFPVFNSGMDYGYMVKTGGYWGGWVTVPNTMYATNGQSYIALWDVNTNAIDSSTLNASVQNNMMGQLCYLSTS